MSNNNTNDTIISVENVTKDFRLPHEKYGTLKSLVVNFYKRKKGYEIQEALKDVTFEIKRGEFFGIVGRNGSGKSTLLKLLAGIYTPTKGSIQVNGGLTPFIELGVGFNPELTGRENVFLNGALLGFNRKEMKAMYDDIVDFAEISRFMDQKLKNYSSGMQVRLAFSIAIRARSDILLLDEVLAVGDAAFQKKCFDYFYELKQKKSTVCFVSHDMASVQRFCDKALYLENGKIVQIDKPGIIAELYKKKNEKDQESNEAVNNENQTFINNDIKLEAHIINSKGKSKNRINSDEDIYIEVIITAKKQVSNAIISFTIEDENAITIMVVKSSQFNIPNVSLEPNQKKRMEFKIENIFAEGNYIIDMEVSTSNRSYIYGHQDQILKYKIVDFGEFPWLLRPKVEAKQDGNTNNE